ncbi:hypothetical protein [Aureibaculum luteum]|uniref:hypothetical protein n=1 Tax=Aureibaculum luteum TaxID=1548456 RepID=UPI000E47BD06|nr:hypothetical protein [Aureibaculum luteum]
MKNLIFGLYIMGLTNLSYSQNLVSVVDGTGVHKRSISSINVNYLDKVQSINTSKQIKTLEIIASKYDITKNVKFNGSKKPFKVKFKGLFGSITATYNPKGKILNTIEEFKNVALPKYVMKSISEQYPQASILATSYFVSYNNEIGVTKQYIVKIKKGKKIKNLKFDNDGIKA